MDLAYLKERGINPITPVLVCGGFNGQQLNSTEGPVKAGETVLMEVPESAKTAADNTEKAVDSEKTAAKAAEKAADGEETAPKNSRKGCGNPGGKPSQKPRLNFNFDFLQKLGKVLMTVIAVMPAAGLMISLGKLVQMAGADLSVLMTIGKHDGEHRLGRDQ